MTKNNTGSHSSLKTSPCTKVCLVNYRFDNYVELLTVGQTILYCYIMLHATVNSINVVLINIRILFLLKTVTLTIFYFKMGQWENGSYPLKSKYQSAYFGADCGLVCQVEFLSFRHGKYSGLGSALMCPLRMIAFRKGALVYWTQGFIWSSQAAQIV